MEMVGYIGVGDMGAPIAARILLNGVPVLAYDKNPDALGRIVQKGAIAAGSIKEIVDQCDVVFACLLTADVCREVALGSGGVFSGAKVKVYVELSTMGSDAAVDIADALAGRGITLLDSPIVGGAVSVDAGTVGVLVSGPKTAFEKAKFALDAFAGRLFYLGEKVGMGQVAKVMNNSVAFAAFLSSCEAIAAGMKAGIDMDTCVSIINQGSGANFFTQRVFPKFILQGRYDGTGAIEIPHKDVNLFIKEAARMDMDTPVAKFVSALQKQILPTGAAGRDTMTTFHYFSDLAGLPRQG